jgi:hypothetical protein
MSVRTMLAEWSFSDEPRQVASPKPRAPAPTDLSPSVSRSNGAPQQASTLLLLSSPKSVKSDASSRSVKNKGKERQRTPSTRARRESRGSSPIPVSSASQTARQAELMPPPPSSKKLASGATAESGSSALGPEQVLHPTENIPSPAATAAPASGAIELEHGPVEDEKEDNSGSTISLLFDGIDEFVKEMDNLEKVDDSVRAEWDAKLQSGRLREGPKIEDAAGADAVNAPADPTGTTRSDTSLEWSAGSASGEKSLRQQGK